MKQAASSWALSYIQSCPQWWWSWEENLWYFLATGRCLLLVVGNGGSGGSFRKGKAIGDVGTSRTKL